MASAVSCKKDVAEIVRRARRQGWVVDNTGGHLRFTPPDRSQSIYFAAKTPGDFRGTRNMVAELKQRGYVHARSKHRRSKPSLA